jgi:hypothetical protein
VSAWVTVAVGYLLAAVVWAGLAWTVLRRRRP